MRSFTPLPSLGGRRSFSLGIAKSLRRSLSQGQLRPDEFLPSTRQLAASFGVHRHTVQAALELLESEGLLESYPRRGFRVTREARKTSPVVVEARAPWPGFRIVRGESVLEMPSVKSVKYPLHSATPDPLLVPHAEIKAAYAHTLRRRRNDLFELGDERGLPEFRDILSDHLRQNRNVVAQELMVTHGSQEALSLVARALLAPGDHVAVEEPGYPPAWHAFRAAGARVLGVAVDAQGLDVEAFEKLAARKRIRLLYTTPGHQFPTSVTLAAARRKALLECTARHGIPILEDDYDHEYQYRGLPLPPLAAERGAEHVIYVATLSKLVSSGVRLGCIVAGKIVIDALVRLCRIGTRGHDPLAQAALSAWMRDGGLERHLRRARRAYTARREALLQALAPALENELLSLRAPDGGLGIWARWHGLDSFELARSALGRGILVLPEQPLRLKERASNGTRISFSRCTPEQLSAAGSELVQLARQLRRRR